MTSLQRHGLSPIPFPALRGPPRVRLPPAASAMPASAARSPVSRLWLGVPPRFSLRPRNLGGSPPDGLHVRLPPLQALRSRRCCRRGPRCRGSLLSLASLSAPRAIPTLIWSFRDLSSQLHARIALV